MTPDVFIIGKTIINKTWRS